VHPKQKVKILSLTLCAKGVKNVLISQFLSAPLFLLAFLSQNADIFQPIENDEEDGNLSDRALDLRLLEGRRNAVRK
jgi:hypothetical protein